MATGWHCSESPDLTPRPGFCVADDRDVAASYLRGGLDATHYLYEVTWDAAEANAADEATLIETWERITGREHDESQIATWDVAKNPKVRRALQDAGYTAIVYGDSHEGCNYETTEFLATPASLTLSRVEEVVYGN